MKRILLVLFLCLILQYVNAEMSNKFLNPDLYQPSIFNLNNITMNHSVSFQSGINSNNEGYYLSMYTNHISYQIHPKLSLKVDLHFVNFGTATYNKNFDIEGNNDNQSTILPEIQLDYRPNDNFNIHIEFGNRLYNNYNSSSLFDRWDN